MQFYLISALIFSLIVAIFAVQNTEIVIIKFLAFQTNVSLVLVILGSAVIGALVTLFLSLFKQVKNWMTIRHLNSQNEELVNKVNKLTEELQLTEKNKPISETQQQVSTSITSIKTQQEDNL